MIIKLKGKGLDGGYGELHISRSRGFEYRHHKDSGKPIPIPLDIQNMAVKNHLVSLGRDPEVKVIEHLFSALYGLSLFDVKIDFWGDEIPFFDGSSAPFVAALSKIKDGNPPAPCKPKASIIVRAGGSFLRYDPGQDNNLVIDMQLSHPYIATQRVMIAVDKKNYVKNIAPARTFAYTTDNDPRLKNLPPYGIGVTAQGYHCATPLRFSDELVRHKILDLLGDLFVLRRRLVGRITGRNTSHRLNLRFARALIKVVGNRR
jgi:UDP-3-O-[3-hydroxymyristoyl] N-acetylglucosamine deacetylase